MREENNLENESTIKEAAKNYHIPDNNIPSGVSIESASYIENNNLEENEFSSVMLENSEGEHTPKLFSEDQSYQSDDSLETKEEASNESEHLFDQDADEEEDFEIPAFLRKQKF